MKKLLILISLFFLFGCLNSGPQIKIEKVLRCLDEPNNIIKGFCNSSLPEKISIVQGVKSTFVGLGLNSMKCENKKVSLDCNVKIYTESGKTILDDSIKINDLVEDCDKKTPEEVKAVCYGFLNDLHLTNVETTYFFDFKVRDNFTGFQVESIKNKLVVQPVKYFDLKGLTFTLPENWRIENLYESLDIYKFASPSATLVIKILELPENLSQPIFTDNVFDEFQKYEDYNYIRRDFIKIDRRNADSIRYNFTLNGQKLAAKDHLIFRGRKAWLIAFSTLQENFEEQEKDLQELIDSIKIVG